MQPDRTADAKSDVTPETVSADAEALMNFSDVNETVTAKQSTNLVAFGFMLSIRC